jgi:hypothetical protein
MTLTYQQKNKLISIYPELRSYFDLQELKDKSQGDAVLAALISRIDTLKGEKGDSPVKGIDYWTDAEINQVIAYILKLSTPVKGTHYNDGIDGKDYVLTSKDKREIASSIEVPIIEKVIERTEVIKEVPVREKLDVSMIKDAVSKKDLELRDKKVLDGMARVDGRIKLIDQRWGAHGGGLSKVTTDTTLTGLGTPASPLSVVSSGSFVGSQEKSTTTPDGVLTTFAFTHTPRVIFWNGQFQTLTDDYTVSVNNITFQSSAGVPVAGDKIVNLYA